MEVRGPRIRDFTDPGSSLPVKVEASPVFELLLSLFVFTGEREIMPTEYDSGSEFIERFDTHASDELRETMSNLTQCGGLWLALIGEAYEATSGGVDQFLSHLGAMDPVRLREVAIRNSGFNERHGYEAETIAAAAAGDAAAVEALDSEGELADLAWLLNRPVEESRDLLIATIRRFHDEVFVHFDDHSAALERDAADKRALARTLPADKVVEAATGGVTFTMQHSVSGILLVPSFVITPWAVIAEHRTLRIFCYSVPEESLTDGDAPPAFLVEMYKALGDENRLRLLSILADGEMDLKTLAQRVDLAKSTTHHHLRALRSAGLVRVLVGDKDKKYSLRKEALEQAGPMLENFVISRRLDD